MSVSKPPVAFQAEGCTCSWCLAACTLCKSEGLLVARDYHRRGRLGAVALRKFGVLGYPNRFTGPNRPVHRCVRSNPPSANELYLCPAGVRVFVRRSSSTVAVVVAAWLHVGQCLLVGVAVCWFCWFCCATDASVHLRACICMKIADSKY